MTDTADLSAFLDYWATLIGVRLKRTTWPHEDDWSTNDQYVIGLRAASKSWKAALAYRRRVE